MLTRFTVVIRPGEHGDFDLEDAKNFVGKEVEGWMIVESDYISKEEIHLVLEGYLPDVSMN